MRIMLLLPFYNNYIISKMSHVLFSRSCYKKDKYLRLANILDEFDVFLTVHHSIDFSKYQLSAQFF